MPMDLFIGPTSRVYDRVAQSWAGPFCGNAMGYSSVVKIVRRELNA